ncbi:MAG TPA: hypothetical protein VEV83_06460, partial [Parafilimonas sp.]|nr:hypothetical protein [Parafilimonas sp.]
MRKFILPIAACFVCSAISSQDLQFVENKGQWDQQVKFKTLIGAGAVFLQQNGYRVILNNPKELVAISNYLSGHTTGKAEVNKLILHSHAYQVAFLGAAANPDIVTEGELETYNNYFVGSDPSKWTNHCRIFNVITYKNVYPGIDVRYYTQNHHLEYDFVVHPGADIRKIRMRVDGVDELNLSNGDLVVKTSVGEVQQEK